MAQKITMNGHDRKTVAEVFDDFVISQTARGLTEVTLTNYRRRFTAVIMLLSFSIPFQLKFKFC